MRGHRLGTTLLLAAVLAAVGSAFMAASGASSPVRRDAAAPAKVSFRLDFFLNEAHSGVFAAVDRGYYAAEGIELDLKPGQGSVSTVQQVAAGNDTFGLVSAVAMTQQIARGADVLMIASPRQVFDGGIIYWPDRGISNPKSLEGKTMALTAAGFVALLLPEWARRTGVDLDKVNRRVLDTAAGNALFGARRVDALEGTKAQQLFYAPVDGIRPKFLAYSSAGLNALGQGIITKPGFARANPGVTTRFLRATLKGWNWACDNPRAAVTLARTKITTTNAPERSLAAWKLICSFKRTPAAKGMPFGSMALKDWGTTVTMLRQSPQLGIQDAVPGAAKLFTNVYVDAASKSTK